MDNTELFNMVYSVTWQQGIIYPEQLTAILNALILIEPPRSKCETTMRAGEIARHIGRIIKGEVWKPGHFRLTKEQKDGLEQAKKMLLQLEDNELDYEKGRYD